MEYAEGLARSNTSATVDIPTLLENGSVGRSKFLIGPASQLITETEPTEHDEIIDEALIKSFQDETRELRQNQPHRLSAKEQSPQIDVPNWIDDL